MGIKERYAADIAAILARQGDNGGALWATADRRLLKGAPFSTLECVDYLLELGLSPADLPLPTAAQLMCSFFRLAAAQHRLDAGHELHHAEWLDEVIVRAEVEAADLVVLRALGRSHDDRDGCLLYTSDAADE